MGIFDLATDIISGDWGGLVGDVLGTGFDGTPQSTSLVGGYNFSPYAQPISQNQMPVAVPVSAPAVRAVAAGIAAWSVRFPALWQAIQKIYANTRTRVSPEKLITLMNKYGPAVLTGWLGAQAVSELMLYKATRKRRRMNVANTRALRRSLRRLKGFDRLSGRVMSQLAHSARGRRKTRCGTCRKSPCRC